MDSRSSAVAANALLGLAYRGREEALNGRYPRLLVLLTGHFVGMDDGLAAIRRLGSARVRRRIWADEHVLRLFTVEQLAGQTGVDDIFAGTTMASRCAYADSTHAGQASARPGELADSVNGLSNIQDCPIRPPSLADFDALLFPVLSPGLLNRLAQLDTDDPFAALAVQALCAGKPVGALALGADPTHYRWSESGFPHAAPPLIADLQRKLDAIAGYGIAVLEPDRMSSWLKPDMAAAPRGTSVVLTADDILTAARLGRTRITIPGRLVVTPLAADLAREHGIVINGD